MLFLLFVAGSRRRRAPLRSLVACSVLGLVAAALSIGVQGGVAHRQAALQELLARHLATGFASTFGRSALIAFAVMALIALGLRSAVDKARGLALAGAAIALLSFAFAGHVVTAGHDG